MVFHVSLLTPTTRGTLVCYDEIGKKE